MIFLKFYSGPSTPRSRLQTNARCVANSSQCVASRQCLMERLLYEFVYTNSVQRQPIVPKKRLHINKPNSSDIPVRTTYYFTALINNSTFKT